MSAFAGSRAGWHQPDGRRPLNGLQRIAIAGIAGQRLGVRDELPSP